MSLKNILFIGLALLALALFPSFVQTIFAVSIVFAVGIAVTVRSPGKPLAKVLFGLCAMLVLAAGLLWTHFGNSVAFAGSMAIASAGLGQAELEEVQSIIREIGGYNGLLKELKSVGLDSLGEIPELKRQVGEVRRLLAARAAVGSSVHVPGLVSDDCARCLTGIALAGHLRRGGDIIGRANLESLMGDCLAGHIEVRTALTTSDIPLPTVFSGQIVELVSQFGTARRFGTVFPLGAGQVKLPKLTTDPTFGLIASSATVTEKSPQLGFVTFNAEKFGGLIRVPSEIDADSIVPFGQFIARYAARQIAFVEDTNFWSGTGAGSGINGSVQGFTVSTITNSKVFQMATTNTHYSDVTLSNMRSLRAVPDEAALRTGQYYCHTSFESKFASFNTAGDKPYIQNGVNGVSLDGFPINWIPSMPAFSVAANVSKVFVLFGDPSFQYLGIRGGIRFETSIDAGFATDEILMRALERLTIGLMANGCMGGLETAAS